MLFRSAGNAARKDQLDGKAAIANKTSTSVFNLLQNAGELPDDKSHLDMHLNDRLV